MNRLFITLLFLISSIPYSWSQDKTELKFSTIHFIRSNTLRGGQCLVEFTFPNQRSFQISDGSIVEYKLYSTGKIRITYNRLCITDPKLNETQQIALNVESGKDYYIHYHRYDLRKQVEKSDVSDQLLKYKDNTLVFEENLDYPIIKESIKEKNEKGSGQGSGFLVNDQGYILTNHHVIDGAKKINIKGIKGDFSTSFEAKVVSVDPQNDIALLQVTSKIISFENPPYTIGQSTQIHKAEQVYALGYPMKDEMGQELKITDGIISSLTGCENSVSMFQFSANVNPGNSGGPLLNKNGEVVGIVTAKSLTGTEESISYAVKSDYVKLLLDHANIDYQSFENSLLNKSLSQQVEAESSFIYTIETE